MDFIFRWAEDFMKKHKRIRRWRRVFAVLAAVVVFATTYELILPAITIDRRRAAETPGMEVGVVTEGSMDSSEAEDFEDRSDSEEEEKAQKQSTAEADEAAEPSGEPAGTQGKGSGSDSAGKSGKDAGQDETAALQTGESSGEREDAQSAAGPVNASVSAEGSSADSEGEDTKDREKENKEKADKDKADKDKEEGNSENVSAPAAAGADGQGADQSAENQPEAPEAAAAAGTEAAAQGATNPEQEMPCTLTFESEDYTITAGFDETAGLPEGTTLNAVEILPDMVYKDEDGNVLYADYGVYWEKAVEALEKDNRLEESLVASARFFDIAFSDPEGNSIEPTAPVIFAIEYKKALSTKDTVRTFAVRFDDEKNNNEIIETRELVKEDVLQKISFEADKASVYGIAAAQKLETREMNTGGDTYEICVRYNQKAEFLEGATLEAYELMPGTEGYEAFAAKSTNTDENGETASRFFNISVKAEGKEYEPKAPVDVKITLKGTSPEEVAADKKITHFTNAGEVENIPQVVEESDDGGAEVSFQMDSFSTVEVPLLGAGSTKTFTISVGGRREIPGADSTSTNSWCSSDNTVATVSGSSNKATVAGVKVGNATITHTYTYVKGKGKKQETVKAAEDFAIRVVAASDQITETANASDGDIKVCVKRTGTTKKLEGRMLVVEKLTSGAAFDEYARAFTENGGDTSALKGMYHIYLKDKDGNEVSVSNANMEVTITDPALAELSEVNVGHFKKNNSGEVESKGFTDAETTVFKKSFASNNSITIKIQSFSVVTVSLPTTAPSGTGDYSYDYKESSIMGSSAVRNLAGAANQWQIVKGKYENNTADKNDVGNYLYKTVSDNGKVRVQKNVIPTDVENEFLMYLGVDINRESILQEFFEGVGIVYTPSNSAKGYGDYWGSGHTDQADQAVSQGDDKGSMRIFWPTKTSNTGYKWTINITAGGRTYKITRYATSGNFKKGHIVMKLPNGWITVGDAAKTEATNTGSTYSFEVEDSALQTILKDIKNVEIGTVSDYMGPNIKATEIISYKPAGGDNKAEISADGKTINWKMVSSTVGYTSDGWYPNIAELVYKIKYDPAVSTGLVEDGKTVSEYANAQVPTNSNAELTYKVTTSNSSTTATQKFPSPEIRGMLYEIKGTKVDMDDSSKTLSDAVFTLYSDETCTDQIAKSKTGENGIFDFQNLQWGTYYLKETEAPKGYKPFDAVIPITVCYTTASKDLTGQGPGEEALYKTAKEMKIENEPIRITVKKVWKDDENSAGTRPDEVSVTLKANGKTYVGTDRSNGGKQQLKGENWEYTWSAVPQTDKDGNSITYTLDEAPVDGYISEISYKVGGIEAEDIQLSNSDAEVTVTNTAIQYDIRLQKVGQDKQIIKGADVSMGEFDLRDIKEKGEVDLGTDFKLDKYYVISENKAPDGYNLLSSSIEFRLVKDVSSSGGYKIDFKDENNESNKMLSLEITPSADNNPTILILLLTNNEGAELPETGGTGFLSLQTLIGIVGMSFVLAVGLMYGFKERRGERRYK